MGYVNLDLRTDLLGRLALLKCAEGIVIPLPDPEERRRLLREAYDMVLQVLQSDEPDEDS